MCSPTQKHNWHHQLQQRLFFYQLAHEFQHIISVETNLLPRHLFLSLDLSISFLLSSRSFPLSLLSLFLLSLSVSLSSSLLLSQPSPPVLPDASYLSRLFSPLALPLPSLLRMSRVSRSPLSLSLSLSPFLSLPL